MQFGKMLYLDEFRYLGAYEVIDYESRKVGIQIRNRQNPPERAKRLVDNLILRRVE